MIQSCEHDMHIHSSNYSMLTMTWSKGAGISATECRNIILALLFTHMEWLKRRCFNKCLPLIISKWPALLVITSSFPMAESMPVEGGRCLQCNDFNRQIKGQCVSSYKECGPCLPGFMEDDSDHRVCAQIELIESPSSLTSEILSDIHLPCKFFVKVECFWLMNGHRVEIGGRSRYQYTDTAANDGDRRHDCSLDIRGASYHDTGQWTCGSLANSETDSFQSKPIQVLITKVSTDRQPQPDWLISSDEDITTTTTATEHGHPTTKSLDQVLPGSTHLNADISALKPIFGLLISLSILFVIILMCLVTLAIKCT